MKVHARHLCIYEPGEKMLHRAIQLQCGDQYQQPLYFRADWLLGFLWTLYETPYLDGKRVVEIGPMRMFDAIDHPVELEITSDFELTFMSELKGNWIAIAHLDWRFVRLFDADGKPRMPLHQLWNEIAEKTGWSQWNESFFANAHADWHPIPAKMEPDETPPLPPELQTRSKNRLVLALALAAIATLALIAIYRRHTYLTS